MTFSQNVLGERTNLAKREAGLNDLPLFFNYFQPGGITA